MTSARTIARPRSRASSPVDRERLGASPRAGYQAMRSISRVMTVRSRANSREVHAVRPRTAHIHTLLTLTRCSHSNDARIHPHHTTSFFHSTSRRPRDNLWPVTDRRALPDCDLATARLPPAWLDEPVATIVDRTLVHKDREENVLLHRVASLPGASHQYAAQIRADPHHRFFFEHPVDHIPGLLLVEAARQFGIAVAHIYYSVPSSYGFILRRFDIQFEGFASLDEPTFMIGVTTDRAERRGVLTQMTFDGGFVQRGRRLGRMTGVWRMAPAAVLAKLRGRRA